MKNPKPLWVITFDPTIPEKTFQERALFSYISEKTPESDQTTLDFLSKVNTSLKNITEAYLSIAEANEELKPKAEEIRQRLNLLNQWLGWFRSWIDQPPQPPKKEEDID